jgi:hypothetical protein
MRAGRAALSPVVMALVFALVASPSPAQDEPRQRAPGIRVYSQNGAVASRYVTPAIEVSEDAYVFAVSFDLDGQIQILHPDFPGISVRILSQKPLHLPNFFAGFSQGGGRYDATGRYVTYADGYVGSADDSRGTVIALASRAPFNLERVESGGDWNISTIRSLIEHRAPSGAAHALAAYLGAKGAPIGIDYMRFASAQYHDYYASSPMYTCDLYYGRSDPGVFSRRLAVLSRVEQLRQAGQGVRLLGYDFCGMPIIAYGPSQGRTGYRPQLPGESGDTAGGGNHIPRGRSVLPRGRSAQSGWSDPEEAAIGTFPLLRRREEPQTGDVLITPLRPNRRDPREIFNEPRNEGIVRESVERGRAPAERNEPRTETPVIGTFPPAREYPRPLVREAPLVHEPPVMREQPPSPPPAPPRAEPEPRGKPVSADPVPPPLR